MTTVHAVLVDTSIKFTSPFSLALSFLSSRQMAEAYLDEASTGEQSFQSVAETIHRVLPGAVAQYAGCAFRPFGCGSVLVAHPPSLAVDTST